MDGSRTLDGLRYFLVNQLGANIKRGIPAEKSNTARFWPFGFYWGGSRKSEFFLVILRVETRDIP